jgi:ADP-ribose pyrophosphatase YjhB (NUDIX family)
VSQERPRWPFAFCPSCGSVKIEFQNERRFRCHDCGFGYYHNVATGSGVLIVSDGRLLLLRRGRNPGKGLFTVPGGFVDPGESAEEAVVRECREEAGLEIDPGCLRYLTSAANRYLFGDVPYTTCDIFFYALLSGIEPRIDGREATEALFVGPEELDPAILAFPSTRLAAAKLALLIS